MNIMKSYEEKAQKDYDQIKRLRNKIANYTKRLMEKEKKTDTEILRIQTILDITIRIEKKEPPQLAPQENKYIMGF